MFRFPRVFWVVALASVLLSLPSLFAEFYCDDQILVSTIEGGAFAPIPGRFHLYSFMTGAPGERDWLVQQGALPWWTVDGIRISFFRPLSSVLLVLDHAIAGRHPLFYHVHSLAWYVLAVLGAALLFRRLLPERAAALAAMLFAVSPAHWMLAAWPSARHEAISGALVIFALLLHLEAREQIERRARWLSVAALACAALALCGGETGLGLFGYLAAYELVGRREPLLLRLRALVPWGVLLFAYVTMYKGLGFGVRGAGGYVDPTAQPRAYFELLPIRLAVYLEASLLCIPSELSMLAPKFVGILAALGLAAGLAFAALLRRAVRVLDAELNRTLAWLLLGALLAVLPGSASMPGDRVLFLSNLAVCAALSLLLLHAGSRAQSALSSWLARAGLALFGLAHVVFAPLLFAFSAWQLATSSHAALEAAVKAELPVRAGMTVAGIGLADPQVGMYLPWSIALAPRPEPRPVAIQLLSTSAHDHVVKRTGERSLEISILNGALLEGAFESLFRPENAPLRVGDRLPLGAWTVEILDERAGRPTRFSVSFDRSVDDPSIALLIWKDGALRSLAAPSLGERVLVKHEPGPMGI